ncbi:helix-turn-helix domain-containing protein [Halomonas faecis]|nr:helix-turn-helix transcriptional regulator [Halomonas faecis]
MRAGISQGYLSEIEAGKAGFLSVLKRIADVLGVERSDLT